MAEHRSQQWLTFEEYLELEQASSCKHDYVDGEVFALVGASEQHNRIVGNMYALIWNQIAGTGCRVMMTDTKVRPNPRTSYYPDIVVDCDPTDDDPLVKYRPCLVVEVLSPATESIDRREKRANYLHMDSLQAYLMIYQDRIRVDRYWRDENGEWHLGTLITGSRLPLPCPPITVDVTDIYREIEFAIDAR
jgi:Uma2 family endonuclease